MAFSRPSGRKETRPWRGPKSVENPWETLIFPCRAPCPRTDGGKKTQTTRLSQTLGNRWKTFIFARPALPARERTWAEKIGYTVIANPRNRSKTFVFARPTLPTRERTWEKRNRLHGHRKPSKTVGKRWCLHKSPKTLSCSQSLAMLYAMGTYWTSNMYAMKSSWNTYRLTFASRTRGLLRREAAVRGHPPRTPPLLRPPPPPLPRRAGKGGRPP